MRKLLFAMPLCFAVQVVFSEHNPGADTEITSDPEPNWNSAAYTCPLSVKTVNGEFRYRGFQIFHTGRPLAQLAPAPRKHIFFTFDRTEKIDMVCGYEGLENRLVIQAKGLTACGAGGEPLRAACWTTDPYAGKK
jgi:hypothetical protein